MVEVIRWITIVILWICIIANGICIRNGKQLQKRLNQVIADKKEIPHCCEDCGFYNPTRRICPRSQMIYMGDKGFCSYISRKEDQNDRENHD